MITKSKNTKMIWILGAFTTLILSSGLLSPTLLVNSYAQDEKVQELNDANLPITLPLIKGFVGGNEVSYITTEVSDENIAKHLSELTNSRVVYAPSLKSAPAESLANIYEFKNGIKGTGPQGFQPNVADSQPGDSNYSPLWKVNVVDWSDTSSPRELKSEADILKAQKNGELTITTTDLVVNCPFVKWNGGELKIREDKTINDQTPYGGGQVLSIDPQKGEVTFIAHRGFAPDGSTIYYIATDASVQKVADDLGVVFVNKTASTLKTAASSDLFVFTNGIKGTGPLGFQASISSTNVGDEGYSPLWRIQATTWKDPTQAEFLTDASEINMQAKQGHLTTEIAGAIVNCPFVEPNSN